MKFWNLWSPARGGRLASLRVLVGIATLLTLGSTAAQAQETIAFRWREAVQCGPEGTLRFASGARLDLIDPLEGSFEFRGVAREGSRQREGYTLTLTFINWDDQVLFQIASEPFEMEPNRRTAFVVSGSEQAIAEFWDEIAAVDLDTEVPLEPLFEEALDFYGEVLSYRAEQDLEGRFF